MAIEKRRGSVVQVADTALLVFVAVVAGFVALNVLGWILGTVLFLVKAALVAVVVALVVAAFSRLRRR